MCRMKSFPLITHSNLLTLPRHTNCATVFLARIARPDTRQRVKQTAVFISSSCNDDISWVENCTFSVSYTSSLTCDMELIAYT